MTEPISLNKESFNQLEKQINDMTDDSSRIYTITDPSALSSHFQFDSGNDHLKRIVIAKISKRVWSINIQVTIKLAEGETLPAGHYELLSDDFNDDFHINEHTDVGGNHPLYELGVASAAYSSDGSIASMFEAHMNPTLSIEFMEEVKRECDINVSGTIVLHKKDSMVCHLTSDKGDDDS